ncbi:hypothetical protein EPUS_01157 [Endocarpon pusillum Z07020]|uniref:Uncharacterized protein n=1 Tax=Endocarpon pusillum (strain Z07020 / HMAS-L-300199) TaxID=1263415 RepID=U1HGF2_ENDPU|nr:uncharacterized protein EPUS_01157 [Endocarpon pusillum Z07020]ERF69200.1 hypothetical protein EPUS_01157 [Endocarpon pusillum Z07020]
MSSRHGPKLPPRASKGGQARASDTPTPGQDSRPATLSGAPGITRQRTRESEGAQAIPAASTKREPRASVPTQLASAAAGINDEAVLESLPSDVKSAAASLALRPPVSRRPSKPRLRRALSAATESLLTPEEDNTSKLSGASSLRSTGSGLSQGSGPSAFIDPSARPSAIPSRKNSDHRAQRARLTETTQARLISEGNHDNRPTGAFTGSVPSQYPAPSAYTEPRLRAHPAAGEATSAPSLASSQRPGVMYMDRGAAPQINLTPGRTQAVHPGLAADTPVGRHQQMSHLPSHRAVAQEDRIPLPQTGIPSLPPSYSVPRRRRPIHEHQQGRASAREGSEDLNTRAARDTQFGREAGLQSRRDQKQDILKVKIAMVKEHIRLAENRLYHHQNQVHPPGAVDQQAQAEFYRQTEHEIHTMQRQLKELERDYRRGYGSAGSGAAGSGASEQRAGPSRKRSTERRGARDSADNPPACSAPGRSMTREDAGAPSNRVTVTVTTGLGGESEHTASHARKSHRKWKPCADLPQQFE